MTNNPFASSTRPPSRLLTETDFNTMYAATAFAYRHGLLFDMLVTLVWGLMGPDAEADVSQHFNAFQKCLREYLEERSWPVAWIYSHEHSPTFGLHTHLAVYVPGQLSQNYPLKTRAQLRKWANTWPQRRFGRPCPKAVRVTGPATETSWLHWQRFGYLMKGYDSQVVVQSAEVAPDRVTTFLGDLIPWQWVDPGPVPLKQRVGHSRSLGPQYRAVDAPPKLGAKPKGRVSLTIGPDGRWKSVVTPVPGCGFRSRYEDGVRDVRLLYPPDFYKRITRQDAFPPPPNLDGPTAEEMAALAIERTSWTP